MVLDPADPDTFSAGSFFTNPILREHAFAELVARAAERLGPDAVPPSWPASHHRYVKTSAAWLIERAGFARGYGDPDGIAISSKHTLALTNRGAGTTAELVALAREIAGGVHEAFGVELVPEPVFVGHDWGLKRRAQPLRALRRIGEPRRRAGGRQLRICGAVEGRAAAAGPQHPRLRL